MHAWVTAIAKKLVSSDFIHILNWSKISPLPPHLPFFSGKKKSREDGM